MSKRALLGNLLFITLFVCIFNLLSNCRPKSATTNGNESSTKNLPGTNCQNAHISDVICGIKRDIGNQTNYCLKNGCDHDASLCYTRCSGPTATKRAYHPVQGLPSRCYEDCPVGWQDNGISCYKFPDVLWKDSYDRGRGGYGCSNGVATDTK